MSAADVAVNISDNHPWPYLREMFELKHISPDGKSLKFSCVLCKPLQYEVSAYYNSPSNLRKHVQVCSITLACDEAKRLEIE